VTEPRERPLRIGHKGADAIVAGNTLESFRTAAEIGVDIIELDVLRPRSDFSDPNGWRNAPAGPVSGSRDPLLVAHDWGDAARRDPLTLAETLAAFTEPPLDRVEIDVDLKVAGREDELLAALGESGMRERAMVSTMELGSIRELRRMDPSLRLGWTVPKTYRDWTGKRWARPLMLAGLAALRARLPAVVRRVAPSLGVWAVWAYHGAITPRLIDSAHGVDVSVVGWTVDDPARVAGLTAAGIDGICTNDPRLLLAAQAGRPT
jgi:glycerophosphoryl diester phosphodiesterase